MTETIIGIAGAIVIGAIGLAMSVFLLALAADILGIDVAYIIDQYRNKDN